MIRWLWACVAVLAVGVLALRLLGAPWRQPQIVYTITAPELQRVNDALRDSLAWERSRHAFALRLCRAMEAPND